MMRWNSASARNLSQFLSTVPVFYPCSAPSTSFFVNDQTAMAIAILRVPSLIGDCVGLHRLVVPPQLLTTVCVAANPEFACYLPVPCIGGLAAPPPMRGYYKSYAVDSSRSSLSGGMLLHCD